MPTILSLMENLDHASDPPKPITRNTSARDVKVLAWGSGILAVPGGLAAIYGCFLIAPPLLFLCGFGLLIGYIKACRGTLSLVGARVLWRCSAIYNGLLFVASAVFLVLRLENSSALIFLAGMAWQGTACWISLQQHKALGSV